jgi:signal transduction histidine kinase
MALTVLPLALACAAIFWSFASGERARLEQAMATNAETSSHVIDREIAGYIAMLQALGRSQTLADADWSGFHAFASQVAADRGAVFVSLFAPDGRQILNTAKPFGSALPNPFAMDRDAAPSEVPPRGDVSSLHRVLQTGRPSNSNLFRSLSTGKAIFTVDVPVLVDGSVRYVLNIGLEPQSLASRLSTPGHASETFALVDGNAVVVARTAADGSAIGTLASSAYRTERARATEFVAVGAPKGDRKVLLAAHTSPLTGWTSVVQLPKDDVDQAVRRSWGGAGIVLMATLLFGFALATVWARRLASTVRRLLESSSGGDGEPLSMPAREFIELTDRLEQARRQRVVAIEAERLASEARMRQTVLEEIVKAKDRFAATLAHELRNPLQVIGNAIALLRADPGRAATVVDVLERQHHQISRLAEDIVESARVAQGKVPLKLETVNLAQLVEQVVQDFRSRAPDRVFRVLLPSTVATVLGDPVRLVQVLTNLLHNAVKCSPAGTPVEVELHVSDGQARLRVVDHGIGLAATDLEQVFEPFVQLQRASGAPAGLGLGLPLSRELLRLHGGTLRLESPGPGEGCIAEMSLPVRGDGHDIGSALPAFAEVFQQDGSGRRGQAPGQTDASPATSARTALGERQTPPVTS